MHQHEKINYLEFPSSDLNATKQFFSNVFGWLFTDYGEEYIAFDHQGIEGGFFKSDKHIATSNGSALIVFYSNDLESTQKKIINSGGKVVQDIFPFPGGRRFHFTDLTKNEYAVWSDN